MDTPHNIAEHLNKRRQLSRRKRNLTLVTLFFIVLALGAALVYFLIWQHEEETDNAYVAGHLVQITPQTAGTVRRVTVDDTDIVKKGDVLAVLDDTDFQLEYDRAQNELIQAIRQNKRQALATSQAKAQVVIRKAELAKAQADLRRRESLEGTDAVSGEELSHARAAVVQAQAALKAVEAEADSAQAMLGKNIPLRQQPAVQTAISRIKDAWLNLQRTQIRAPMAGQIAKRNIQVGQRLEPGALMMAVVPLTNLWVDANFKEAQLRKIRIGQPAVMTADLYGNRVVYHGKVMGLSAGTGNAFTQSGTHPTADDWTKTAQRIPVRISLNPEELKANPLRVGLSMSVKIDTSDSKGGKNITAAANRQAAAVEADAVDWSAADALIEQIFEKYAR